MLTAPTHPIRIIRLAEVKRRTGLSTSTIYSLMAEDKFPRQVSLGPGTAVGWVEAEVDSYIAARVAERDERRQKLG
jgi:prophage regulatory protein